MHRNEIIYALICINNHVLSCLISMLSDRDLIDPITLWIKGFSFHEFEDDRWHLRINFSLFSQQNLPFKYSSDAEIDLEAIKIKRFKDCFLYTVRLLEKPQNNLHRRRTSQFIGQIGRDRWIGVLIFDQWLWWNANMQIVTLKSRRLDRRWTVEILSHRLWWENTWNIICPILI